MRLAIQTILRAAVIAAFAQTLSAQAAVPSEDSGIYADAATAPCSAPSLPPDALVPTGDVWIAEPADALRVPCRPSFSGKPSSIR